MNRSYAITIRTRVGINECMEDKFDQWIEKQTYGVWTMEKENTERHIHAQIWMKDGRTKGNVVKSLKRILGACYTPDDYIASKAILVRPAFNNDYVEYMKKDGIENMTGTVPNEDSPGLVGEKFNADEYYPTEEEQIEFLNIAESRKNWTLWSHLETLWGDREVPNGSEAHVQVEIAGWLSEMMFVEREIKVESDSRKRQAMLTTFVAYLRKKRDWKLFVPKNFNISG